ncbi:hypothetical protein [Pontibacter pudoricolor]|uniref:hypothetical protein n=1 Tax=Pontibacter pudoricolor TaxID=2694930 RepID=UPI001390DF6B|nr:hypothetical protein [Pontibacter pudoricolor]
MPSRPGGPVFGHRAVYISFAPSSQCLTAPEIYKALNPKTEIFRIATFVYSLNRLSFDLYRGCSFVGTGRDLSDKQAVTIEL